jgi:hypothetical protein
MKIFLVLLIFYSGFVMTSCCSGSQTRKETVMMNTPGDSSQTTTGKNALDLTPEIEIKNDTLVLFSVQAVRNFVVEDEYIPSSETLRVRIFSTKGAELWNSGQDQVFKQVIMNVLPEKVGETYRYSVEWNGRKNNGALLGPGKYTVVMTIPAKPRPYTASKEFDWKVK